MQEKIMKAKFTLNAVISEKKFRYDKFTILGVPITINVYSVPAGITVSIRTEFLAYFATHSLLVAYTLTNKNKENINSLRDRKTENVNRNTTNLITVKKVKYITLP